MRICLFTATIDKKGGGPSRSVPILAKGLDRVGVDVTLMTGESDDMNTHAIDNSGVKLVSFPRNLSEKQLEKLLLEGKYDLIHGQGIWMPLYHKMCRIARRNKIPYMMTPRGALEPWCYYDHRFLVRIKKMIAMAVYQRKDIERAACVLTTALMESNSLCDLGFTNVPKAIIPNGIEIDDYPCRADDEEIKLKKQVMFLSRIDPKKGLDILIDAWVNVHKQYPEWNVVIAGNGNENYIAELRTQIERNKLTDCVQIFPPVFGKKKYQLYIESQLFVLPTHSENFGMVIAEALACGVPVITTKGTPWQIIEDKRVGWWIDLSRENLEATLLNALSTPRATLFNMGKRGAQLVRERFHYVEVAKKLLEVYEWIVNSAEKPATVV